MALELELRSDTRGFRRGMSSAQQILNVGLGVAIQQTATRLVQELGAAVDFVVERSGRLNAVETGFQNLASAAGFAGDTFLQELRPATRGLISDFELMEKTNTAVTLGIVQSEKQWGQLVGAAQTLGRAVGRTAAQSVDDLTIALGRQSPRILDNLGIQLSLNDAYTQYARRLGTTVDELTDVEKRTAFVTIATERIVEAAKLFAYGPTASFWTMGLNQRIAGVWANNLIYNIHLLTGKIAEPGNSPFSLTGQPSACGTAREVGTLAHALPGGRVAWRN